MNEDVYLPIIDLHCDLLSFLAENKWGNPLQPEMGASLPFLKSGNVKLQIMAVYTDVVKDSTLHAKKQIHIFNQLVTDNIIYDIQFDTLILGKNTQALLAIENAAGLCEEDMPLAQTFKNLDAILEQNRIAYISLTHHTENRFGGGNYSDNVGLKPDGKTLVEYLDGKGVAIDLSHTSDALAYDLLDFTLKKNLNVPIIASHSNFRAVFTHVRNLPTAIVEEIVKREGLIGINFLRAYVHNEEPEALLEHLQFGLEIAPNALSFGADFFYTEDHPDPSRKPFYFEAHENASKYPSILTQLERSEVKAAQLKKLAYQNAVDFFYKHLVI